LFPGPGAHSQILRFRTSKYIFRGARFLFLLHVYNKIFWAQILERQQGALPELGCSCKLGVLANILKIIDG